MWYKVDIIKFAFQLVPPLLRGDVLLNILRAILTPFKRISNEFEVYREIAKKKLQVNGVVISIEKAFNDHFNFEDKSIYITDVAGIMPNVYLRNQIPTHVFNGIGGTPVYLINGESVDQLIFTVNVPSSLRTREAELINLIEFYKPAGRNYDINYYENE